MRAWTFRDFIRVLERNGFALDRQKGATRVYKGSVQGQTQSVTIHFHRGGDDIKPGTLASMIRQSGLPKRLFR